MKAALWCRVSTDKQDESNQLPAMQEFAARHGHTVVKTYELRGVSGRGAQKAQLREAMDAAHRGEFDVLITWSLDRISRLGVGDLLTTIGQFRQRGCVVLSVQESWMNAAPEVQELLTAVAGFVARFEAERHSERVKAGIAKRRAQGLPVGRIAGSKDRKPRRRSGYFARYGR